MALAARFHQLDASLSDFLFATIGEEENEVGLCLLGVLFTLIVMFGQPPTDRRDGADGESGPGGGGHGPGRGGPGGPSPEGGDPVWWPEFERQFADYVASAPVGAGPTP